MHLRHKVNSIIFLQYATYLCYSVYNCSSVRKNHVVLRLKNFQFPQVYFEEAVVPRFDANYLFWQISQYAQGNTCSGRFFAVNFVNFFKTTILGNACKRLPLALGAQDHETFSLQFFYFVVVLFCFCFLFFWNVLGNIKG